MSASIIDDIDSDHGSMRWGCDPPHDDQISVSKISMVSDDLTQSSFIPQSPEMLDRIHTSSLLESLMNRYPAFVPASLPPSNRHRRQRPLCLFINFMGTRTEKSNSKLPLPKKLKKSLRDKVSSSKPASPCPTAETQASLPPLSKPVSPCPSGEIPSSRPAKRQKISAIAESKLVSDEATFETIQRSKSIYMKGSSFPPISNNQLLTHV